MNVKLNKPTIQIFQPYQKVLVKAHNPNINKNIWLPAIYGGFDVLANAHVLVNGSSFIKDDFIIPYKGNEYKAMKEAKDDESV